MNAVRFERDGDLGAIVLCSPPNWLTRQFSDDLAQAVRQAAESDVRALLIRAEGEDFSVGYQSSNAGSVDLYIEESLTFRINSPEAAVHLDHR